MSEAKPPYVIFETRAIEDREASIENGRYCHKDVDFAIVTPAGTKDRIEKEADAWLRDLEEMVRQERFPSQWLHSYKQMYVAFKEGKEIPLEGTSILNWPGVSPAQTRILLEIGIRTVEQMAEATEEAISYIGMGGRALKSKAQAFLDTANDTGKTAEELSSLRQKLEELVARDAEREERLKALERENEALKKADKK